MLRGAYKSGVLSRILMGFSILRSGSKCGSKVCLRGLCGRGVWCFGVLSTGTSEGL